jgi:hypothetical protein
MNTKLAQLQIDLEAFSKIRTSIWSNFLAVVLDESIPVQERWVLWRKAPAELKDSDGFTPDFEVLNEIAGGDDEWNWYSEYNVERYQSVDLEDMVDKIQQAIDGTRSRSWAQPFVNDPSLLDRFKEEIMTQNIREFKYDW